MNLAWRDVIPSHIMSLESAPIEVEREQPLRGLMEGSHIMAQAEAMKKM